MDFILICIIVCEIDLSECDVKMIFLLYLLYVNWDVLVFICCIYSLYFCIELLDDAYLSFVVMGGDFWVIKISDISLDYLISQSSNDVCLSVHFRFLENFSPQEEKKPAWGQRAPCFSLQGENPSWGGNPNFKHPGWAVLRGGMENSCSR